VKAGLVEGREPGAGAGATVEREAVEAEVEAKAWGGDTGIEIGEAGGAEVVRGAAGGEEAQQHREGVSPWKRKKTPFNA